MKQYRAYGRLVKALRCLLSAEAREAAQMMALGMEGEDGAVAAAERILRFVFACVSIFCVGKFLQEAQAKVTGAGAGEERSYLFASRAGQKDTASFHGWSTLRVKGLF